MWNVPKKKTARLFTAHTGLASVTERHPQRRLTQRPSTTPCENCGPPQKPGQLCSEAQRLGTVMRLTSGSQPHWPRQTELCICSSNAAQTHWQLKFDTRTQDAPCNLNSLWSGKATSFRLPLSLGDVVDRATLLPAGTNFVDDVGLCTVC